MQELHNRLIHLNNLANFTSKTDYELNTIYEEKYKIRKKIDTIKIRKYKIDKIFNGR